MEKWLIYLYTGSVLELLGILTFFTNQTAFIPEIEAGFSMPVILFSPEIQGAGLFILGSVITVYGVIQSRD